MKTKVFFTFTSLLLVCMSCTSITITSSKNSDIQIKLDRVIVAVRGSQTLSDFCKALADTMSYKLTKRGVETKAWNDDGLQLDGSIEKIVEEYKPNAVLFINQTEGSALIRNGIQTQTKLYINATLFQPGSKELVWRANIEFVSNNYGKPSKSDASQLVNKLLNQFIVDGLI